MDIGFPPVPQPFTLWPPYLDITLFQDKDSTRWKPDETNNECGVRSIPAHIRAGQTTKVITTCENLMFFAVVF